MKKSLLLVSLFLGVLLAAGTAPAQTPQPAQEESLSLKLRQEEGQSVVLMQDLFHLVDQLFDGAVCRWDPVSEILRIEAAGHRFDMLTRRPLVIRDGKLERVSQPLQVRKGAVYIPASTVEVLLSSLGVDFDLNLPKDNPAQPNEKPGISLEDSNVPRSILPTPTPVGGFMPEGGPRLPQLQTTPETNTQQTSLSMQTIPQTPVTLPGFEQTTEPQATPTAVPAIPAVLFSTPQPQATPQQTLASQNLTDGIMGQTPAPQTSVPDSAGGPADNMPATVAMAPQAALEGKGDVVGLSWGELADLSHRTPPQNITVVFDNALKEVAQQMGQALEQTYDVQMTYIQTTSGRRDQDTLFANVQASRPELLVDLLNNPLESAPSDTASTPLTVWVVHQALWPLDAQAPQTPSVAYRRHQYQSLALGSLVRTQLSRQFADRVVLYELSPSYLMRRVDAPSVAVLIPTDYQTASGAERLARAVGQAVGDYVRGMQSVQF